MKIMQNGDATIKQPLRECTGYENGNIEMVEMKMPRQTSDMTGKDRFGNTQVSGTMRDNSNRMKGARKQVKVVWPCQTGTRNTLKSEPNGGEKEKEKEKTA